MDIYASVCKSRGTSKGREFLCLAARTFNVYSFDEKSNLILEKFYAHSSEFFLPPPPFTNKKSDEQCMEDK